MRRLNVTQDLLFVVLWGGNESEWRREREQYEGGDEEEEGDSGNGALVEARTSGRPAD